MFVQLQALATRHTATRVQETRAIRDASLEAASEAARAYVKSLPVMLGEVDSALPSDFAASVRGLVSSDALSSFYETFDEDLHVSAMSVVASRALPHFESILRRLFPAPARQIAHVRDVQADDSTCFMLGPIKNPVRTRAKIGEMRAEGGAAAKWPLMERIGDLVRASIICPDMDAYCTSCQALSSKDGFDVRPGHGRLKVGTARGLNRLRDVTVLLRATE